MVIIIKAGMFWWKSLRKMMESVEEIYSGVSYIEGIGIFVHSFIITAPADVFEIISDLLPEELNNESNISLH